MAQEYVFTMYGMSKSYGQRKVLDNINLCFFPGAKIGVVGSNGSGKSTLLKIIAGLDTDFTGTAAPEEGVSIGFVPQEPKLDPELTVRQTVEGAFSEIKGWLEEYDEVTVKMGEDLSDDEMQKVMDRMGWLQDRLDAADGWELDRQVDAAADAMVLPPDDAMISVLSGGELRRVALCKALLEKPDILLLDEPTNHLDSETVDWLEAQLRDYPGTVLIVTHDRYFLDNVTKWILELEGGKGLPFEGNYTSWLEQKLTILAQAEKKESERRKSIDRELRWIRMSAKDRAELSRERLGEYEQFLARETAASGGERGVIQIPAGPRLGDRVLEFNNVEKTFEKNVLIRDLTFKLPRGAIVGVVGPNGAGKTTLFRMALGFDEPSSGDVALGETVEAAYVDQSREGLDDDKTVWEEISGGQEEFLLSGYPVNSRQYVSRFNLRGQDQQKRVGDLSGGERNRVHLAKLIRRGGNFLLLDEPTNDLDVNALRMLEDAIHTYIGCALIISHDRFFLDRVCTHMLIFEGEAKVRWFEGNYQDYEIYRRDTLGEDPFKNRRKRYRTLTL